MKLITECVTEKESNKEEEKILFKIFFLYKIAIKDKNIYLLFEVFNIFFLIQ